MARVSAVILTLDEQVNVERSVHAAQRLTDDVVVVDSGSSDRTRTIAERAGARVVTRPFDDFARQRNAVLDSKLLRGGHALFLDADEVVTPRFAAALLHLLASDPEVDGVQICRRLHFWGKWVPAGSGYPCYIDRVVRVDRVRFRMQGQSEVFVGAARTVRLAEPLHDEDLKPIGAWIERQNHYAEMEARHLLAAETRTQDALWRRIRGRLRRVPGWPLVALFYYWFVRLGFFEGRPGRTYCAMRALHEYLIQLHLRDLRRKPR